MPKQSVPFPHNTINSWLKLHMVWCKSKANKICQILAIPMNFSKILGTFTSGEFKLGEHLVIFHRSIVFISVTFHIV